MPKSPKDEALNRNDGDRYMGNLGDQIKSAHVARMRELGDLIVNKLPFLPEEMAELRKLIEDMSENTFTQRNVCLEKFAAIERMIDNKIAQSAMAMQAAMQQTKLDIVREMTTSIVQSEQLKDIVKGFDEQNAKNHKRILWGIAASLLLSVMALLKGTALYQPIVGFLISIIKVVL